MTDYTQSTDYTQTEVESAVNSKTAAKKTMQKLQALGEQLLQLSPKKLALLPLSSRLVEAIVQAKNIKKGDTLRRQIQLIGKLMRSENEQAIHEKLAQLKQQDRRYQANIASADQWCQRLLEDSTALSEFVAHFPDCERQQLTQVIRLAKTEVKKNPESRQGKYKQRLFKHVQTILS